MKQVLQSYRTGELVSTEVPAPGVEPGSVLVLTTRSLISVGTERQVMELGKRSLVGKARARPDLVKKVLEKVARDGLLATRKSVLSKLDQPIPLGYSAVGRVLAVGEGVTNIRVGDRVACAGAKVANHAELNLVPRNLCAPIPEGVADDTAAFVTLGAIALQGVRIAQPTLGETFAVIGLGLIGQLVAQLLRASGCRVIGIDLDDRKVALAKELGATTAVNRGGDVAKVVSDLTGGRGVDGVLITAATSSNDPVALAGDLSRDRARVVVVGAVGMDVPRRPYYDKELSFFQSRSYGPGRYDPAYEEQGHDYPIGYVRWTEQRNMEAFLQQCATGAVKTEQLVSHRFPIDRASEAYELVGGGDPLGVLLEYAAREQPSRTIAVAAVKPVDGAVRIGVLGAGNFAAGVLVPAIAAQARTQLVAIASNRGFSARHLADKFSFQTCSTDASAVVSSAGIDAVFVVTRHDLHAAQTVEALRAGKHVFVEKPLAIDRDGLAQVLSAHAASGRILTVGFNRRFAPLAIELAEAFAKRKAPLVLHYRVNAGEIPGESWIHDPAVGGGRIIGEACHFVDFCSFLTGATPVSVFAQGVSPVGTARSDDNVTLSLRYSDGSLATIAYVATGDPSAGKEHVEVIGDGKLAVLDDFRSLTVRAGGKERTSKKLGQDKGHAAGVARFLDAVKAGGPAPIAIESLAATTEATFAAVESLATGEPVTLGT
ncbi:MAG TPA: bi-domain-containing oxidoreductase [Myxococcales bacterium]|jgi:polar amino acid transport system substrate-binding protein